MEGRVFMSKKDLSPLEIITKVIERRLTIAQAAEILSLSTRITKKVKNEGGKGIVSKKVRAPINHRLSPTLKEQALTLILKH